MGNRSDIIVLVLGRGENSHTLFRVCRSWQCMYVLTILTWCRWKRFWRAIDNVTDERRMFTSLRPRANNITYYGDDRSRSSIDLHVTKWYTLKSKILAIESSHSEFRIEVLTIQTCDYFKLNWTTNLFSLIKWLHNFLIKTRELC